MAIKPRKIANDSGQTYTVYGHAITKNFWEYYILDGNRKDDIRLALVHGHETEIGDVSMSEIRPYVFSYTSNLMDLAPPIGWHWVD